MQTPEAQMVKVLDYDAVIKHECLLKHLIGDHALCWEFTQTYISTQYAETEENSDDLMRKAMHAASVTSDYEDAIMWFFKTFLVKEIPLKAVKGMRVEDVDIKQLIWILGDNILAEIHCADYIGSETKKFQDATTEEEKQRIKDKIDSLERFLYTIRSIRKKMLSGFLNKG